MNRQTKKARKGQNSERKRVKAIKKCLTNLLWCRNPTTTNSGVDKVAQLIVACERVGHYMLYAILLSLLAMPAYGQGVRYDNLVLKPLAVGGVTAVSGALITVCTSAGTGTPCTPKVANIYSDEALTTPITGTGGAGTTNSDANGNYGFYIAPGSYVLTITGTGIVSSTSKITLPGLFTAGTINGVCMIDGVSTNRTTLALAIADATCNIVDDRGFKSGGTIASTITFPNGRPVIVMLGKGVYTGPASGSTFVWPTGSHGSSLIGAGKTSGHAQTGQITITKIISNASNTSDVLSMQGAAGNGIQGVRLEHLMVDGANSAVNCITADTVQVSNWNDLDVENCTGVGYNFITTNTVANSGTSFDTFTDLHGFGSPTLMFCGGNAANTADFTANTFVNLQGNFGVGASTAAGIWLNKCDGNVFEGVTKPFRSSGTGCDLQLDARAFSNQFYDFYGNTGCNVTVATPVNAADFNFIYGYDITNGEAAPQGAGANTLAFQPNGLIGGAGGPTGLIYPNNSCVSFWNSTTGQDCVVKFDASNNLHFISQETANYLLDSANGTFGPNSGTINLGGASGPWSSFWLGTAATNNFKFQPAATAAARIITIADPLSPSTVAMPLVIANGTATMTTALIATVACGTTVTVAATGVLTTDVIDWSVNSAVTAANNGLLILKAWPTAGNVNFNYCNPTAAGVTPTATTVNWSVRRP